MFSANLILWAIRLVLISEIIGGIYGGRAQVVAIAFATLVLTVLPDRLAHWIGVTLPNSFLAAIALFVFATLFLGEVGDYYERFWWWDVVLHFGSAVSFGLFGFLFIFMLFEGDSYAAPPWAIAFLSFCFAMSVGAVWEVFEFAMDEVFGLNMQKSGLQDTMWDLIVDGAGALLGASAGYLHLKGRKFGSLGLAIDEFVALNKRLYGRVRRR